LTLQLNAPSGGQGYRTGLRGGGPLTTLVLEEDLWRTCWLNIMEKGRFLRFANHEKEKESDRFPWLSKTRTSEKKGGVETTAMDIHPDQLFWTMPRRIRLTEPVIMEPAICDMCGLESDVAIRQFFAKNYGINYTGPWKHPLTPSFTKDNVRSAIHPQPGGIGYRHWLGLVQSDTEKNNLKEPAEVVTEFIKNKNKGVIADFRLWAFGYDMDNMKARCWYDGTMPLIVAREDIRNDFEDYVERMVRCAMDICMETRSQIKKALFKPERTVSGDLSFINGRFWKETESDFFNCVLNVRDACEKNEDQKLALAVWHKRLAGMAETLFNDYSQAGECDAADPKMVATAWKNLQQSINGKKIRGLLGLV